MWIVLNDSYLSIVGATDKPDMLMVRARLRGDIEAVFNGAYPVTEDLDRDYRFRALIPRRVVAEVIADRIESINYGNFKNSVKDDERHEDYTKIWGIMNFAQRREIARESRLRSDLREEGMYSDPWTGGFFPMLKKKRGKR